MDSVIEAKISSIFDRARDEAIAVLRGQEQMRAEVGLPRASDDEAITVAEAARLIGVSRWRVYEMVRRGLLPASRPSPRTVRLRRGAVKEFIRMGSCTRVEKKGRAKLRLAP